MANNRINKYIGALALGTVLLAVPGCTDTWDDHYNDSGSAVDAKLSLWEQISSDPNYSRFAGIAKAAKYYKDIEHPVEGYTFADILASGQVNTIWLPDNSAISAADSVKWMEMCQNSGFEVQQQLMGNHIALWRHNISEPGVDTVKMINGKHLVFDKTNRTFAGVSLKECNIPTTNGVMHTLAGIAPFHYNFYEHLKNGIVEPNFKMNTLREYVLSRDTTYFNQDASIEGKTDNMGRPTYVDSVYMTTNRLFYLVDNKPEYLPAQNPDKWVMTEHIFAANINEEDSMFIMLMPTNDAWNAAKEKLASSHVYAAQYDDKEKGNTGTKASVNLTKDVEGMDVDSWTKMSIEMDIVSPLVFNVNKQPKISPASPLWTLDQFVASKGNEAKYLLNTYGDTLRTVAGWDKSSLFNGNLIKMSNGYGYELDSWDFPWQFVKPDVCVETDRDDVFYYLENQQKFKAVKGNNVDFSNARRKEFTKVYGEISNNKFYNIQAPSSGAPSVEVKLVGNDPTAYVPNAQVMSGEYEVQLVIVPSWYKEIAREFVPLQYYEKDTVITDADHVVINLKRDEEGKIVYSEDGELVFVNPSDFTEEFYEAHPGLKEWLAQGSEGEVEEEEEGEAPEYYMFPQTTKRVNHAYIAELAAKTKNKIRATLNYNDGKATSDKTKKFDLVEYDGLSVDTLSLGTFEFPVSYKNLRYSYPTLTITSELKSSDTKNGYVYDICIDKVILKSKEVKESEN